jgi:ABC-2 type transport system permease protein
MLQQTTYRLWLIAGLVTNGIFGVLRAAVITALYAGRPAVNGLTLQEAITFVAVSQAMIAFMYLFGTYDVMTTVYTGSIGSDLLKPVNLFTYWLGKDLGRSLVNLVMRGAVLMAIYSFFYPLKWPAGPGQWLAAILALGLGWLVTFAYRFLVNLASFWTPDARGIARGAFTLNQFLSGFLIPLRLYPDWFSRFCQLTPFPAMFNAPVEVYLGLQQGPALWGTLLSQVGWFLAFSALSLVVMRAGLRRLVIQGG